MKYPSLPIVATLVAAAWPAQAAELDLSKLPPPAAKKNVTYAKDIRPIFESTCFRCHGDERQKGDLRLDTLEDALKGGEDGKVIIPGQSAKSPLVIAVARLDEEKAMPPKPKPGQFRGRPGGGPNGAPGGGPNGRPGPGNGEFQQPGGPGGPGGFGGPGGPAGPRGGGGMGPMPKPLTPEQVGLIRAWIDQGAK